MVTVIITHSLSKPSENIQVPQRQSTNFRLKESSLTSESWNESREAFDTLQIIHHGGLLVSQV